MKEFAEDADNDYIVYYYMTTLDAKFVLMLEKKEQRKEDRIRGLLQSVHKMYTVVDCC